MIVDDVVVKFEQGEGLSSALNRIKMTLPKNYRDSINKIHLACVTTMSVAEVEKVFVGKTLGDIFNWAEKEGISGQFEEIETKEVEGTSYTLYKTPSSGR